MNVQSTLALIHDLGYHLLPPHHPDGLGHSGLLIAIRPKPTHHHYDPYRLELHVRDMDGDVRSRTLSWLSPAVRGTHVCPGRIMLVDRNDRCKEFYTFGGVLEIITRPDILVCSIHSPVPILELDVDSDTVPDLLAAETESLLAKTKSDWGQDSRDFNRRLAEIDPVEFYMGALHSITNLFKQAPAVAHVDQELADAIQHEKRWLVEQDLWSAAPLDLAGLLVPGD